MVKNWWCIFRQIQKFYTYYFPAKKLFNFNFDPLDSYNDTKHGSPSGKLKFGVL